ncbi:MAG: C40 family peptidase [Halanaerobiaceae bacterium]
MIWLKNKKRLDTSKLFEVAEKLEGIPYEHNGRNYEGVDCWGVVYLFFEELGIHLPVDDGKFISDKWYKEKPQRYLNSLKKLGKEVGHYKNLYPLDIPYFNLYRNVITHTSVMLDDRHFVHVLIDKEVTIDSMERRFWRKKYKGARRIELNKYREQE